MRKTSRYFLDFLWRHEISADLDLFDYLGCWAFYSVIQLFNQMIFTIAKGLIHLKRLLIDPKPDLNKQLKEPIKDQLLVCQ